MGILAMYIWFMFATPFILRMFQNGQSKLVFMTLLGAWLVAQTGVSGHIATEIEAGFAALEHPLRIGIFFNILGWQIIFFGGLYLGWLQANDKLDLSFLKTPDWYPAFKAGLVVALFLAVLDRVVWNYLFSPGFTEWFLTVHKRGTFSSLYLLSFALNLFLVTWLIVAGQDCGNRVVAWASNAIQWLFTRRALVFLGQHSLHVFSAHILITYAVNLALQGKGPEMNPIIANLVVLLSPAPLYLAAWGHQWSVERSRKRQQPVAQKEASQP